MIHPENSILLASIREQACAEWEGSVQEHIDECDACHTRYMELLAANAVLNDAVTLSIDQTYPSIVENVMLSIGELNPAFARPVHRRRSTTLAILFAGPKLVNVALALVVICVFVVTAILFVSFGHVASSAAPKYKVPIVTATTSASFQFPGHRGLMPTPKPTATPVIHVPTIYECQQPGDDGHKRLRICGEYFTPRDSVQLIFTVPDSHNAKTHKGIVVQDDGTFEDTLSISSCKSVPSAIRAYDQTNLSEVSEVLQDIQMNSCTSPA